MLSLLLSGLHFGQPPDNVGELFVLQGDALFERPGLVAHESWFVSLGLKQRKGDHGSASPGRVSELSVLQFPV